MSTDRVAGLALAALGVLIIWESLWSARRLPLGTLHTPGPAYMPVVLAALLLGFGLLLLPFGGGAPRLAAAGWSDWRHAAAILAVTVFAALMLERLGFRITIAVVLAVLLGPLEKKGVLFTVAYAAAFAFGAFYLFDTVLRVPLPRGPFGL